MNPTRRSVLAGLATLAVVPVVAACGSDSPRSASPASDGPKGGAEEGAFPVTITHKYGETTVEAAPERVVCVGLTDQDTLLALGIVPVGVSYWFGEKSKRGIYTWAEEAFGDAEPPTLLMNTNGVEIEHACDMSCACTTCHVIVREGFNSLNEMDENEEDLLDRAWGLEPNSRLSCQAFLAQKDLVVEIPRYSINHAKEKH